MKRKRRPRRRAQRFVMNVMRMAIPPRLMKQPMRPIKICVVKSHVEQRAQYEIRPAVASRFEVDPRPPELPALDHECARHSKNQGRRNRPQDFPRDRGAARVVCVPIAAAPPQGTLPNEQVKKASD